MNMMTMQISRAAQWFALGWAALAYVILLRLPLYSTKTTRLDGGGVMAGQASLPEVNGPGVYVTLAIPLLTALLAVVAWRTRFRRSATLLAAVIATIFAVLGSMTIGGFFLPTAVALIVAAVTAASHRPPVA
jgi:hypothetical protein